MEVLPLLVFRVFVYAISLPGAREGNPPRAPRPGLRSLVALRTANTVLLGATGGMEWAHVSHRCAICFGNVTSLDPIYLKFVAGVVAPKEGGRRKCIQNRHVQEIPLAAKLKMYSKS